MFTLDDDVIESLTFAMEDQEKPYLVDPDTGLARPADECSEGEGLPPPRWSSRDGFRVMERFVAGVRRPSLRLELGSVLARGRGVFKAFKAALAAYPEAEVEFRLARARALRARIREWYDELREAEGLERLGPEPEETEELVEAELGILVGSDDEARRVVQALLDEAETEGLEELPLALLSWELERLRADLEDGEWRAAWVDDGEGGAVAAGLALRETGPGASFWRLVFLYVMPGFRGGGIGASLVDRLAGIGRAEGAPLFLVDGLLIPADYAAALGRRGFLACGVKARLSG